MSNNISLKGNTGNDPWLTVESPDVNTAISSLLELLGDARPPSPVSLPNLIGQAQIWYRAELALGLADVSATPVATSPPPPAQPSTPAQPVDAWGQPAAAQPAATPAPAPAAPAGPLPAGVSIWNDGTYVWLDNGYIANKSKRDGLNQQLKTLAGRFDGDGTKNWYFPPTSEPGLRTAVANAYA